MRIRDIGGGFDALDYAAPLGDRLKALPISLRVLAENAARFGGDDALNAVAQRAGAAVPFRPGRLLLQDMLGLPLLVDMMAMRDAVAEAGGDPARVDMSLPVDLVIDHALTIEYWAGPQALARNMAREFDINRERFAFLKACEARFANLRVVPPGGGIMHQVNLEFLGQTVAPVSPGSRLLAPDTVLGTDSHTPMINALGVLGWGIGGLEAEAILFGEAAVLNTPRVIGLEITGAPAPGLTATDMALRVAETLRALGVVDCFVEMFGPGYGALSVPDRATIANMAPEYGATCVFCPVDAATTRYLRETGRAAQAQTAERYARAQAMWGAAEHAEFDAVVTLDLSAVRRSIAGPAKPEQRRDLADAPAAVALAPRRVAVPGAAHDIGDGDVIVAAITSCTNTANPRHMIAAGLIARNAVARDMRTAPHVKTSLAPGSRVVAAYLRRSGLQESLDALGFHVAAFACSTCNGMSGPLTPEIDAAMRAHDVQGVAVLSGNRNFPGRIHPRASRNLIASPPLVVAYALAGTALRDISTEPLGLDGAGRPVTLADLWPSDAEIDAAISACLSPDDFTENYAAIGDVNPDWTALTVDAGAYRWPASDYISLPPFLRGIAPIPAAPNLTGLRPLVILGDSVTTDHITPSGTIPPESDAAQYLLAQGVARRDFNSFGTRRGASQIVIRSLFANPRLRNEMLPGVEGPRTRIMPEGQEASIFAAVEAYRARGQGLIVIGGRDYGCGSSRDTAAKAPWLAGVRAVIAESFERIHRSNLVNMGIAPLCFPAGVTRKTLALGGDEVWDITLAAELDGASAVITRSDGTQTPLALDLRLYNDAERETFRQGGLLPRAFRAFLSGGA